ncbi:hypothetical protein WICPIJ_007879 [Wickerhamomyces pijperi]|uniref:Uncharacterized protein n=1 Tax=Wickerhamomyces pijperi TaxID=599730 RepID=A0A9P8TJJ9_WICPI|nr:hypothetical protein WICPIJ_007879 [Wickerhamomyces pijperi]
MIPESGSTFAAIAGPGDERFGCLDIGGDSGGFSGAEELVLDGSMLAETSLIGAGSGAGAGTGTRTGADALTAEL